MPDTQTPTSPLPLLTWSAPVRHKYERGPRWYIGAGVVVAAIAAYAVITGAWTVAIVAVLTGGMYFLVRDHEFPNATAIVSDTGVTIADKHLDWNEIKGFWLLPAVGYTELHITPANTKKSELVIQTGTTEPALIKQTLGAKIPELTDKHEGLLDAFIRLCKL